MKPKTPPRKEYHTIDYLKEAQMKKAQATIGPDGEQDVGATAKAPTREELEKTWKKDLTQDLNQ